MLSSPAFGKADLTNCERKQIQFAGSIQPHGIPLVLREPTLEVIQVSANSQVLLGVSTHTLLGKSVSLLGGNLGASISQITASTDIAEPDPLLCQLYIRDRLVEFEGALHRVAGNALIVEIEPIADSLQASDTETVSMPCRKLLDHMNLSIQRFSDASTIGTLCDAVVRRFRDMVGYDRVMVYKFDPDGHGKIISEARNPRLDSLLGHHYPATDIPQIARELYIRSSTGAGRRQLRSVCLGAASNARREERARHVNVPPAQHVTTALTVPEKYGRYGDVGSVIGSRRQALGLDRLSSLLPA